MSYIGRCEKCEHPYEEGDTHCTGCKKPLRHQPPSDPGPVTAEDMKYDADDMDRMVRINTLIADMQDISRRFGNTCVYIRRGGLSWGAVALNRRSDDEKNGVFDLQKQHDLDMEGRLEQVHRLLKVKDQAWAEIAALKAELQALQSPKS